MIRKLNFCIFLMFYASTAIAQKPVDLLLKLQKTGRDTIRVNIQLQLANYYLRKPGAYQNGLDSTSFYVESVIRQSKVIHAFDQYYRALLMKGKLAIKRHDFGAADQIFTEVADHYHAIHDPLKEAAALNSYTSNIPDSHSINAGTKLAGEKLKAPVTHLQKDFLLSALKGLQRIKIIKDSLTSIETSKEIAELETKYLSVQKDQKIQELNNQSVIQKHHLGKINRQRNVTLAGVLAGVMLVSLLYFACRSKQRSNLKLQTKQDEINYQNSRLSALLDEKEKLLEDKDDLLSQQRDLITEKEWLLREVHHRVKNNLQIVMSLLYTQSAYLQNTDARDAIRDSQNRVQTISIIHQKLYNKSNVATIIMADYINELIRYLYTCFGCNIRQIKFKEELDLVNIDISQAVPMGLILNEAITNCIKYAFDKDGGEIWVKAKLSAPETIVLSIADNGRGLPQNFRLAETSSLGMEMMKALSKQLGGSFEISNNPGVTVTVIFKIENQLKLNSISNKKHLWG